MADVTIKQFDTRPFLVATLKDLNGAIDLSSSDGNVDSVRMLMFSANSTAKIIDQTSTGSFLSRTTDSTAGEVRYKWQTTDTDTPGNFIAEFQINFGDNTVASVPNDKHIGVLIEDGTEPG